MPRPPSRGVVTSPWGMRFNPNDGIYRMHYGEDTGGDGNYAPATGTVVFAGWDKTGTGLGWAVGIRETMNPSVIWWTGHFGTSSLWNPLKVNVGAKVSEHFTYLGPKGSTGAAKGAHAHQERRVGGAARPGSGTATNPRSYYTTTAGGGSAGVIPQEDDMPQLIRHPNGAIASVGETTYQFHDAATYDADSATFGAYKQVSEAQFNRAVANTQVRLAYLKAAIGGSPAAAVDAAAIAAKVEQTLADDFARLDAQIADLSVSVGPSAEEIAQAVRDEIIAPDA